MILALVFLFQAFWTRVSVGGTNLQDGCSLNPIKRPEEGGIDVFRPPSQYM